MKKITIILVCTLLIITSISAVGQIKINSIIKNDNETNPTNNGDKWVKTYHLNKFDGAGSVQQTSDGGYIIVGVTETSINRDDIWLIKTDSQGNKIWDKTFGGARDDMGIKVRQTSDEGYIIIGLTESYSVGLDDIWLIKTDKDGNKMWDKTFGDKHYDFGWDVKQTADNGYIIAGEISIPGSPSVPHEEYAWLIKTDEFGNLEWDSTYSNSDRDGTGYSVVQALDGSYIIVGYIYNAEGTKVDVWLFKINGDGELLWEKTFIEDAYAAGYSVKLTDDGGYIITGITSFSGNTIQAPYLTNSIQLYGDIGPNAFLIKTDSNGELQWEKILDEGYYEWGYEVQQTNDGGYIIVGFMGEDDFGDTDGLLIKTNSDGEKEWSKTYRAGVRTELVLGSGQQTTDGGYVLAGYTLNIISLRGDVWLIKTDENGDAPLSRPRSLIIYRLYDLFPNLIPILNSLLQRLGL